MSDELLRAVVGLPVAVLWPLGVPAIAARPAARAAGAGGAALLVLATTLPELKAWLLVVFAAVLAARLQPPGGAQAPEGASPVRRPTPLYLALAAAGAAAAAGTLLAPSSAWDAVRDGIRSDDVVFVVVGVLAAVPVTGALVGWTLSPFADRLAARPGAAPIGMLRAGLYIGWCERALVFAFLLAALAAVGVRALLGQSLL